MKNAIKLQGFFIGWNMLVSATSTWLQCTNLQNKKVHGANMPYSWMTIHIEKHACVSNILRYKRITADAQPKIPFRQVNLQHQYSNY